jgi:hypothetical protein
VSARKAIEGTEACDEAGSGDDRLLHHEDPEPPHHAGHRCCCFLSLAAAADAIERRRRWDEEWGTGIVRLYLPRSIPRNATVPFGSGETAHLLVNILAHRQPIKGLYRTQRLGNWMR